MPTDVDQQKLYSTTDAQVWAQEFMKVVNDGIAPDEGMMIGWFANAIETARMSATNGASHRFTSVILRALNELGVPDENYPAPVANAVSILRSVL